MEGKKVMNTQEMCSFLSTKGTAIFDKGTIEYLLHCIVDTCVDACFIRSSSIMQLHASVFPQCDVKVVILLQAILASSLSDSIMMSSRTMCNVSHLSDLQLTQLVHTDEIAVSQGKGFIYGALVTLGPAHSPSSSSPLSSPLANETRMMLNRKLVLTRKERGYSHSPTFDLFFIGSNIGDDDYLGVESTEEEYDMPLIEVQSQCCCIIVVDRLTCQVYLMNSIYNSDEKAKVEVLNTQDSFLSQKSPSATPLWSSMVDVLDNGLRRSQAAGKNESVDSVFFATSSQESKFVKRLSEHILVNRFCSRMEEDEEVKNGTSSSGLYSPLNLPPVGNSNRSSCDTFNDSNSSRTNGNGNGNVMNEGSSLDSRLLTNWKLIPLKDSMIIHANGIKLEFVDPARLSTLSNPNHMTYSRDVLSTSLNASQPICPVALGSLHFSIEEQSVRARRAMMLLLQEARSLRRHFVCDKQDDKNYVEVFNNVDEIECMRYGSFHIDMDKHYNGTSKSAYVFPKCGHIHSYNSNLEGRPCSLCRETGSYVSLKFACEPLIDDEKPSHVFNPCGHAASLSCCQKYSTIKLTASLLELDTGHKYSICPFCACRLDDQMPFSRLIMQTENGSKDYETSLPDAVELSRASRMDIEDISTMSITDHLIQHRHQAYPKYSSDKGNVTMP